MGKGQLILSMGLMLREVCIFAQRATAPSKGSFLLSIDTHVLLFDECAVNTFCAIHIFLLCQLKINQMTEIRNMRFFLGPLALLRTDMYPFFYDYPT